MIARLIADCECATTDHGRELQLGLWHTCHIYTPDYVDAGPSAKSYRVCRIPTPFALNHRFVIAEEHVYLIAHTRVHRVGYDPQANMIFDGRISTIRSRTCVIDFDNSAKWQLIGKIHRPRNDDVWV